MFNNFLQSPEVLPMLWGSRPSSPMWLQKCAGREPSLVCNANTKARNECKYLWQPKEPFAVLVVRR